jgi:hypothetical protein
LTFLSTVDATVSTDAVVDNLLEHLAPDDGHELVLFDINYTSVKSPLLISNPRPMTDRLMGDDTLPFALNLIINESTESTRVVSRRKAPSSADATMEPLNLAWPAGVVSLSHVALPFPPDDPLYGQQAPDRQDIIFLGNMALRGELGLLKLSSSWLLRMRFNPFYDFLEAAILDRLSAGRDQNGY